MTRNSETTEMVGVMAADDANRRKLSPVQLRFRWAAGVLALFNAAALYFYLFPPGGSRQDLELESVQVRTQIRAAQVQAARSHGLASNMQTASEQASAFSDKYFLPARTADATVYEEIYRMATASGVQEREAGFAKEPIDGSADLTLLSITANFEGSNATLMKFLNEADHSPMLLVLDSLTLTASPQQHNSNINTQIRFQAIVREPAPMPVPVSTAGGSRP